MSVANSYLTNFFNEKNITYQLFEIADSEGYVHLIDTEYVITCIMSTGSKEQQVITQTLRKLDYFNQPVTDYLRHLANALVVRYNRSLK